MSNLSRIFAALGLGLAVGASGVGAAEARVYQLAFSDSATGATGVGAFDWDAANQIMTGLHWTVAGKSGGVQDSALAATYQSWSPIARTYGLL